MRDIFASISFLLYLDPLMKLKCIEKCVHGANNSNHQYYALLGFLGFIHLLTLLIWNCDACIFFLQLIIYCLGFPLPPTPPPFLPPSYPQISKSYSQILSPIPKCDFTFYQIRYSYLSRWISKIVRCKLTENVNEEHMSGTAENETRQDSSSIKLKFLDDTQIVASTALDATVGQFKRSVLSFFRYHFVL